MGLLSIAYDLGNEKSLLYAQSLPNLLHGLFSFSIHWKETRKDQQAKTTTIAKIQWETRRAILKLHSTCAFPSQGSHLVSSIQMFTPPICGTSTLCHI